MPGEDQCAHQEAITMLARMQELEREMEALKARNNELEGCLRQLPTHPDISPLVLSPSSLPPTEDDMLQKQIQNNNRHEDDLLAQLRKKDEKIQYLEQNNSLYVKRLRQTEELLYELQWDPSHDLIVKGEDVKETECQHEHMIAKLIEQMRVMERGLREQQELIDELRAHNAAAPMGAEENGKNDFFDHASLERLLRPQPASPSLKSVVVTATDGGGGVARLLSSPNNLSGSAGLRGSQGLLRRRNSTFDPVEHPSPTTVTTTLTSPTTTTTTVTPTTSNNSNSNPASPSTPSWFSYLPFFGPRSPQVKTAVL